MHRERSVCATLIGILLLAPRGDALADSQTGARVALHVTQVPKTSSPCTMWGPNASDLSCEEYYVHDADSGSGYTYLVYLVVALADPAAGVGAVSLGMEHVPEEMFAAWTVSCADSEILGPDLDTPPLGIIVSWESMTNCQRTEFGDSDLGAGNVHAQAGIFYVYSYAEEGAELVLTPHPEEDALGPVVTDCAGVETVIPMQHVARMGLGATEGHNPCLEEGVPALPTTWGSLKGLY